MIVVNGWAVILAAVATFIASSVWYVVFAKARATLSPAAAATGRPRPSQILLELGRNVILSLVLAYVIRQLDVTTVARGVKVAVLLWIGFPLILLTGSVMYERVRWRLVAIHAGDWLIKLVLVTLIIRSWL